ncbi:MAG: hypothetical protein WBF06_07000 [Candidatus Acidiferrales bacterium]
MNARTLRRSRRLLCFLLVMPAAAGLTSCAVPLGAGFHLDAREIQVRSQPSDPPVLHVLVSDRLANVGNRPLDSLIIEMPSGSTFGLSNLRATVDGEDAEPVLLPAAAAQLYRVPFDPAWPDGAPSRMHSVVLEYDLAPAAGGRGTMGLATESFHVADHSAFPLWQVPPGVFSKGNPDAHNTILRVLAPADDLVAASGAEVGNRHPKQEADRVFRIARGDPYPFVVAGQYQEKQIDASGRSVVFWTLATLDADAAQPLASRLAIARGAYEKFFGRGPGKVDATLRVVETQESIPAEFGASDDPGGASFPGGVLLDSRAFAAGLSSEPVLELAEYELARSWFGWIVRPNPAAQILMGRGAGLYAVTLAARARGGESERDAAVADLVRRYQNARQRAADRPLLEPATGYPHEQRVASGYKAALFFVALEERAGTDPMRRAMHRVVHDMAGKEVGANELRSAVEAETHQSFAEFFRTWLNQPGIPAAFLAAHQAGASATVAPRGR